MKIVKMGRNHDSSTKLCASRNRAFERTRYNWTRPVDKWTRNAY